MSSLGEGGVWDRGGRKSGEDRLIKINEKNLKDGCRRLAGAVRPGDQMRGEAVSEASAWEETEERNAEKGFSLMSLSAPQVILHPLH